MANQPREPADRGALTAQNDLTRGQRVWRWLYGIFRWAGIAAAAFPVFWAAGYAVFREIDKAPPIPIYGRNLDAIGERILMISLGHMLILVVLCGVGLLKRWLPLNHMPGGMVSTTGYVHTLIGITTALMLLQYIPDLGKPEAVPFLRTMVLSISMAMLTSVVGWAFGRDFQRRPSIWLPELETNPKGKVDVALEELAETLTSVHRKWQATDRAVESLTEAIRTSGKEFESALGRAGAAAETDILAGARSAKKQLENWIQDASKTLREGLTKSVAAFDLELKAAVHTLADAATKGAQGIDNALNDVDGRLHGVAQVLEGAGQRGAVRLENVASGVAERLDKASTTVADRITLAGDNSGVRLESAASGVAERLDKASITVADRITLAGDNSGDRLESAASDAADSLRDAAGDAGTQLREGMAEASNLFSSDLATVVGDLGNQIASAGALLDRSVREAAVALGDGAASAAAQLNEILDTLVLQLSGIQATLRDVETASHTAGAEVRNAIQGLSARLQDLLGMISKEADLFQANTSKASDAMGQVAGSAASMNLHIRPLGAQISELQGGLSDLQTALGILPHVIAETRARYASATQ